MEAIQPYLLGWLVPTVLAAAAQSGLPAHSCTLLDSEGNIMNWQCYRAETEE